MKLSIPLAVTAIVLLLPAPAAAIDLLEAVQLAREEDPLWIAAIHENRAAAELQDQADAGYLPEVELGFERSYTRQEVLDTAVLVYTSSKTRYYTNDINLTVRQPILRLDRLSEIRRAGSQVKAADVKLAQEAQSLIIRVTERYLELLRARDDLNFTSAELKSVKSNADLTESQHASGLVRSTDLLDARARLAATHASVAESEQKMVDAESGLRQVLGRLPEQVQPLNEKFKAVPPNPASAGDWVQAGIEQNLAVQIARHELDVAREDLKRRRAGHYPTVDLVANLNRKDSGDSLFGGSSDIKTYNVGLQLRVPLFAGGRTASEVRQATELLSVAQQDLDRELRRVDREARDSYQRVVSALARINALEKAVEAQRLSRDAKQEGYNSGLFTLIAVLDADRDLTSARRDLSRARYDYLLNMLRLKQTIGSLNDEDVQAINVMFAQSGPGNAAPIVVGAAN